MTWHDVLIVIPAILSAPGRPDSLRDLLVQIGQQCDGAVARVLPQWRETIVYEEVHAYLRSALRGITRPRVLWLEDDVELCRDFGGRALWAIEQHVDAEHAVSLFSPVPFQPGLHPIKTLVGSQAVAMPAAAAEAWGEEIPGLLGTSMGRDLALDFAFTHACNRLGIEISTLTPSLVQHGALQSACGFTATPHSPTYQP